MRQRSWRTYGIGVGGGLLLVMAILLASGWGSAVAAQITSVFVNNDAAHPVPVHEQGTASVDVAGSVRTEEGIPARQFSEQLESFDAPILGPDPAGQNYAITSVTFNNYFDTARIAEIRGLYGPTADCQIFTGEFERSVGPRALIPPHETVTMTFPQPFVIDSKPGASSCLVNGETAVVVVGYRF